MTFKDQSFRPARVAGLFAAVLFGLSLPFAASSAEIVREGSLYPAEPIAVGNFGTDIALFDDTVVVGNWIQERAYVYRRIGGVWSEQHKFVNNGGRVLYGNAVAVHGGWMAIAAMSTAISGDTILVGAYNGPRDATYVFTRSNGVWTTRQRLTNSGPTTVAFGYAVAIEGNVAAISATRDSTGANRVGAAFVYNGFAVAPPLPNPSVVFQPGGAAVDLTFYGVAGQQYLLQRTETLNPANWITLQTLTAAPDGKISYTDANPPAGGAFYRITPL